MSNLIGVKSFKFKKINILFIWYKDYLFKFIGL